MNENPTPSGTDSKPELEALLNQNTQSVTVSGRIRWRIWNPSRSLNMESPEKIKETITGRVESLIRSSAARTRPDDFTGQKDKICGEINGRIKKETGDIEQKTYSQTFTTIVGVVVCALLFLAPYTLFNLPLITKVGLLLVSVGWFFVGRKTIPIGNDGVVTLLGGRIDSHGSGVILEEGDHWLPWPIIGIVLVDTKEQVEPFTFEVLTGTSIDSTDTDEHGNCQSDYSQSSGSAIIEIILEKAVPANQAMIEAMEDQRIENLQREAERIEAEGVAQRIKKFQETAGVDAETASLVVTGLMKKPIPGFERDRQIIEIKGATASDRVIGSIVAVAQSIHGGKPQKPRKG